MTLILADHQYRAESPSLLHQVHHPVTLAFDGRAWLIAVRGVYGTHYDRAGDSRRWHDRTHLCQDA